MATDTSTANTNSRATRLTAQAGHMIPVEQPELIIQAIAKLVFMVGMK